MFGRKNSKRSPRGEEVPSHSNIFTHSQALVREQREGSEDSPFLKGQKKRFNKGLKMLSVVVKDIVVEKKVTTYKEVADIILKDSIKYESMQLSTKQDIAKEEQNIKRRVYDALNVLISAGILVKDQNKKVRKNDNNQKIIISNKRMQINTLKTKIKNKQCALEEKKSLFLCLKRKFEDLQALIERNKQSKSQRCLNFPFLIIEPSERDGTKLHLKMQSNFQKLCINSNHEMSIHGDMEVISLLKNSSQSPDESPSN